ncbi:MAG: hypothetical protein JJU28_05535 [Cyclobacteriaceae bacterium]|nr:hypothetical protein [Cyclobacteriaceae bacterium]
MTFKKLIHRPALMDNPKIHQPYAQLQNYLAELDKKNLPENIIVFLNQQIDALNTKPDTDEKLLKHIKSAQSNMVSQLEKELKLVPLHYYRNTWMVLGMASFGIPLGMLFGLSLGNMAFLSIGLPIGLAIGLAVGAGMDKKAMDEGRQLDIEIKH